MHRHMEVGLDVADFCAFAADDAVEVLWRGFCEREFGVREMRMCTRTVMMSPEKGQNILCFGHCVFGASNTNLAHVIFALQSQALTLMLMHWRKTTQRNLLQKHCCCWCP